MTRGFIYVGVLELRVSWAQILPLTLTYCRTVSRVLTSVSLGAKERKLCPSLRVVMRDARAHIFKALEMTSAYRLPNGANLPLTISPVTTVEGKR